MGEPQIKNKPADCGNAVLLKMVRNKFVQEAGKHRRVTGTRTDITDRKQVDDALLFANRQLNHIIDLLPDASIVIDKDRIFITSNRAVEEMAEVKSL